MTSFVLVLPAIDPALTRACVESMSLPLRRRTLIVDNSDGYTISCQEDRHVWKTASDGYNIGVASSWNLGVAWARIEQADYLLIVSQSITFGDAGGRDFLAELERRRPAHIMHSQHGWKTIAINVGVFDQVGIFDPVFNPGYYEDSDLLRRMHVAGLPCPLYNDGEYDQFIIDAHSAGDAVALRSGLVRIDYAGQLDKYRRKWGAAPPDDQFPSPYNDSTLDHTYVGEPPGAAA